MLIMTLSRLDKMQPNIMYISWLKRLNVIISISWLPLRQHICQTCNIARHLSLGHSMVTASHRSSEGCRFDSRLGLRNRFSEVRA